MSFLYFLMTLLTLTYSHAVPLTKIENGANENIFPKSDSIADLLMALASSSSSKKEIEPVTAASEHVMYMTGSDTFNKMMHCPCHGYQLASLGVKGYPVEYGPSDYSYSEGTEVKTMLKAVGESTGASLGHFINFLGEIPAVKLAALEPLAVGVAGTSAVASHGMANFGHNVAHEFLPHATKVKAHAVHKMAGSIGHVSSHVIGAMSKRLSKVAAAQHSFTESLPFIFGVLNDVTDRVTSKIEGFVDHISHAKKHKKHGYKHGHGHGWRSI